MPAPGDQLDRHGLTVTEAVERFVEQYNLRVLCRQSGCWTIVHGYGSSGEGGAIRQRLRGLLHHHRDRLRFEPGALYGNPGWTWVYPKLPLPDRQERLVLEILGYCAATRAEVKIVAKFAGHGGVQVKTVLRSLVQQGRVTVTSRSGRVWYQAT